MTSARVRSPLGRAAAALGAFVLSGCYSYIPVTSAPPGSEVRAHLPVETRTAGGAVTRESLPVEGRVVSFTDSLVLATMLRTQVGNFRQVDQADTLRLSVAELDGVELKEFSRGRTLGFTALVIGGAALVVLGISTVAGGSDDGDGGGNGTGVSIAAPRLPGIFRILTGGR